jgi:hypothetical protein
MAKTHPDPTPAPPKTTAGPGPAPRDASLTGQEPRTSRNQPTSPPEEAPNPMAEAPAKPAKATAAAPAVTAPLLAGIPDQGQGTAVVTLKGLYDDSGGTYRVYAPIPQEIDNGGITYDLHDRAAGVYHQRVK